jgi:hypothetical protein
MYHSFMTRMRWKQIKSRLNLWNACYHSVQNLFFFFRLLSQTQILKYSKLFTYLFLGMTVILGLLYQGKNMDCGYIRILMFSRRTRLFS